MENSIACEDAGGTLQCYKPAVENMLNITQLTGNFSISGNVNGLSGTLVLQNNGGDNLSIVNNGPFNFNTLVPAGGVYDVTVLTQPANQICSVANGSGINVTENVMDISVTCQSIITFSYTGAAQSWTVPNGVNIITVTLYGAQGGLNLSNICNYNGTFSATGGMVSGTLNVNPGDLINIYVGGGGGASLTENLAGGFNGGGASYHYFYGTGGSGGGASDIRINGTALTDRVAVAGGGGGQGGDVVGCLASGMGGANSGQDGAPNSSGSSARGGSQTTGGTAATYSGWIPGSNGMLGQGGAGSTQGISGAGGGGYYGGGGSIWSGGGGGSNYISGFNTVISNNRGGGLNGVTVAANGSVTIQY